MESVTWMHILIDTLFRFWVISSEIDQLTHITPTVDKSSGSLDSVALITNRYRRKIQNSNQPNSAFKLTLNQILPVLWDLDKYIPVVEGE